MKKFWIVISGASLLVLLIGVQFKTTHKPAQPLTASTQESVDQAEPLQSTYQPESPVTLPPLLPLRTNAGRQEKTILQRIAQNDSTVLKLAPEQVQAFLAKNTNAESLLAAYNVTSDKEFLRQALQQDPSNALLLASALANDALPAERRQLLERFKEVSPDNPLANYLSARDYLKDQQPDLALKEFAEASTKTGFHDFTMERIQGLEEMYLNAGYSVAEAKAIAMTSVQMPSVSQMRELGRDMSALERQYANVGDSASAQTLARMGLAFAANLTGAGPNGLLSQMVGTVVEREFLSGLDPNATYDFVGQPVGERLTELQAQDKALREAAKFFDGWIRTANDTQLVSYFDRLKMYGEAAALDWARSQLSKSQGTP